MRPIVLATLIVMLTVLAAAIVGNGVVEFGRIDFWQVRGTFRGVFLLFFLALFPRLTLLFSSIPFGGILWWLGFIFVPRYLIAILATITYGLTNPFLVVISWIIALAGESSEKYVVQRKVFRFSSGKRGRVIDVDSRSLD